MPKFTDDDVLGYFSASQAQSFEEELARTKAVEDPATSAAALGESQRLRRLAEPDPMAIVGRKALGDTPFFMAQDEARDRARIRGNTPVKDLDPEGLKTWGMVLGTSALGGVGHLGRLGLMGRTLLQALGTGGLETGAQLATGAAPGEAITEGAKAGAIAGVAEPLAATRVGRTIAGAAIGALAANQVSDEPLVGAGAALAGAALGGGFTRYLRGGSTRLSAPFRSQLEPGGEIASNVASELGVVIPPGNLVDNAFVDIGQGIASTSPIFGGRVAEARRLASQEIAGVFDETLARMPKLTREQTIGVAQRIIQGEALTAKGVAQGYYRKAAEVLGEQVDAAPVRDAAREIVATANRQGRAVNPSIRRIAGMGMVRDEATGKLVAGPVEMSVEDLHAMRSNLRSLSGQPLDPIEVANVSRRELTQLSDEATGIIDNVAASASPEAKAALETADRLWREEVRGTFSDKLIQKIANGQPEDMVDAMLTAKSPGDVRRVREILERTEGTGGPAWQSLQGTLLRRMQFNASERIALPQGGSVYLLNGKKFGAEIKRIEGQDMALAREWFPDGSLGTRTLQQLDHYATALTKAQQTRTGSQNLAVFFNLGQASAIGGALAGAGGIALTLSGFGGGAGAAAGAGLTGMGTMFLLAPAALTRIYTSPRLMRWMTVGLDAPPGSTAATRASLVVLGELVRDSVNFASPDEHQKAIDAVGTYQHTLGIAPDTEVRLNEDERRRLQITGAPSAVDAFKDRVREKVEGTVRPVPGLPFSDLSPEAREGLALLEAESQRRRQTREGAPVGTLQELPGSTPVRPGEPQSYRLNRPKGEFEPVPFESEYDRRVREEQQGR